MFDCLDCELGTRREYYMVHDAIWLEAGKGKKLKGVLCIGCLERRLGRELRSEDFTSAPLNKIQGWMSRRLRARLGLKRLSKRSEK